MRGQYFIRVYWNSTEWGDMVINLMFVYRFKRFKEKWRGGKRMISPFFISFEYHIFLQDIATTYGTTPIGTTFNLSWDHGFTSSCSCSCFWTSICCLKASVMSVDLQIDHIYIYHDAPILFMFLYNVQFAKIPTLFYLSKMV